VNTSKFAARRGKKKFARKRFLQKRMRSHTLNKTLLEQRLAVLPAVRPLGSVAIQTTSAPCFPGTRDSTTNSKRTLRVSTQGCFAILPRPAGREKKN